MAGLEAGATGFSADKVGVMGFSAAAIWQPRPRRSGGVQTRLLDPLFYPVITAEPGKGTQLSFDSLLGTDRTAEQSEYYSLQNRVDGRPRPRPCCCSIRRRHGRTRGQQRAYYEALKAHGVKASMQHLA